MNYQIRSGDTLSRLAQRFGTSVSALMKANPSIRNANLIYAGANLRVPGKSDSFARTPAKAAPKKKPAAPPPSSGPIRGNLGPRADRLANAARTVARQLNSRGWCAKGVRLALEKAGLGGMRVASAWMAAGQLARDPRFREVRLTDAQIRNLPPGAIIVSAAYNSPGNPHGHIAVSLGNGMEASDHVGRIATHGTQRVFIPR